MLRAEIETTKQTVTTDTVSITVGEVASMYTANELNILPEFQRLFRWSIDRKSNFIESILVGIPIPPAFVYENQDGTWELIDGLQRISTLLEFMGLLRDPETNALRRSKLIATKYLPSIDGVVWSVASEEETALDTPLQLFFRRHRIDFQVLKHPSDPRTKFDLFQRLNRGGAYANEQEVRTCSMVLANSEATKHLRELCSGETFTSIYRITPEQRATQRDLDYGVRMMVHARYLLPRQTDVQQFLDRNIIEIFAEDDAIAALNDISWSTNLLHAALGDDALIPPEERAAGIAARFSLRALEGISVGIIRNRAAIQTLPDPAGFIRERVTSFWQQREVVEMSAAGLRGTVRISRSVPFGQRWFNPNGNG